MFNRWNDKVLAAATDDDRSELPEYTEGELELEAAKLKSELNHIQKELKQLDSKFTEIVQEDVVSSETRKEQRKAEAKQTKKKYEQKLAEHDNILQAHIVVLTLKIAEERLKAMDRSSLNDLNVTERYEFREEVESRVRIRIRNLSDNGTLLNQDEIKQYIEETLAALAGETISRQVENDPIDPDSELNVEGFSLHMDTESGRSLDEL